MAIYEYRAKPCGCEMEVSCAIGDVDDEYSKRALDRGDITCGRHGNVFKRVFSPKISRYVATSIDGTKDFTSRRQYAQHLRDEGQRREDATGIPHNYEPIDINDPSVAPENPEAALREQHDHQVATGAKDATMRVT